MNNLKKPCSIASISLVGVSKSFNDRDIQLVVVDSISYTFSKGVTYALMGASGTGKSTLLHLLAGFETPTSGAILYDGHDCALISKEQKQLYKQHALGILLQNAYLLDELSVAENVMLKGIGIGLWKDNCIEETRALLETVQLLDKIDALPSTLSGGQQQRVALARALFGKPDFILADEPTGNLDEKTGAAVIDALLGHQERYGMGIVVSTHDRAVAERMNVILELKNGVLQEVKKSHV